MLSPKSDSHDATERVLAYYPIADMTNESFRPRTSVTVPQYAEKPAIHSEDKQAEKTGLLATSPASVVSATHSAFQESITVRAEAERRSTTHFIEQPAVHSVGTEDYHYRPVVKRLCY